MPPSAPALEAVTPGGSLLVLSVVVPFVGVLLAFAVGGRHAERIAVVTMALGSAIAAAVAVEVLQTGAPLVYLLGGWAPPLGVALRADGLSVAMMLTAAVVTCAVGVFARAEFRTPAGLGEARAPFAFWILVMAVWGALNAVFLTGDLFTAYVALELLTFAAVPLVCLDGRAGTLAGRCAICSSRCSARSSTWRAWRCSTAPAARSTSPCWPSGSGRSPRPGRRVL